MAQGAKPGEGGPAARSQGRRVHRVDPLHDSGRRLDLAAAAPRHLLDRGSQAADLRPALREPRRARLREARRRGRRRHDRRRRRQVQRRSHPHLGPRRRHRRVADLVDPARGRSVGDRPRRDAADARAERSPFACVGADGRPAQDRPRRRRRRAARRGRDGVRDGAVDRDRLRDDARLSSEHVPGRRRDAGSRAAPALPRQARARDRVLLPRRRGRARDHGVARQSAGSRISSGASTCSSRTTRSRTGRRAAST